MTRAMWIVLIAALAGAPLTADTPQIADLLKGAHAHADALRVDQALAAVAAVERIATATRNYVALSDVERIRATVARHRGQQLQSSPSPDERPRLSPCCSTR